MTLSTRFARCVAFALLIAVWTMATLGLVHGTLHVPGDRGQGVEARIDALSALASPGAKAPRAVPQRHAWLHALFGDHTEAQCRMYDHLSHGSAAPGVPPVMLPMLLPAATLAWLEGEFVARWIALFDARGPPLAR